MKDKNPTLMHVINYIYGSAFSLLLDKYGYI